MDALTYLDATMVAIVSAAVSITAFIIMIVVSIRQRRLLNRYKMLLNGPTGTDLERLLLKHQEMTEEIEVGIASVRHQLEAVTANAKAHVQKLGVVRFNAFPDTGSDLSFAIALLDGGNSGVVISSLYGRNESRVYAKPVKNGTSTYTLSEEEKAALTQATQQLTDKPVR